MNDWSRQQHTKSGLIELIRQSQISLNEAEQRVIQFIKQYCPIGTGILAGTSVFVDRWSSTTATKSNFFNFLFLLGSSKDICPI